MSGYKLFFTIIAYVLFLSSKARPVPKLKFIQPKLVSGVNGHKDATYKFFNVIQGFDTYVQLKYIWWCS